MRSNTKVSKVMSGKKPELDWESVRRGKRTRKAVPRRFVKLGNSSPKRVGDFFGSEYDKLAIGQRKAGISEHVPIKKRRHLLGSRASPPSPTGVDDLARAVYDDEFNGTIASRVKDKSLTWDFSGIELLAAAATMDVGDESTRGSSDAFVVAAASELGLKCNESGSATTVCADNAKGSVLNKCTSVSPCGSAKVERRFWDLNTDMDAWVEPSDDANAHGELPNPAVVGIESLALKQEDKLGDASDRKPCSKSTSIEECPVKPEEISHSIDVGAIKKDVGESGEADMETPDQVKRTDAILDGITTIQDANITGAAISAMKIDPEKSYEPQGTITKDEKCVDSTVQNDKACVTGLMIAEQEKLAAKHEEDDLPNEGLERIKLEDSCNSYSVRPHDDLAASVGKVDNTLDPCPDSPYEDGELRESFLYNWEENDLETELVDYESDGRKEDSCDAADNIGSEIVEGGSEGSLGSEGNGEKTSGKKESDGGSGTTVDHSVEMAIDESNDPTRRTYNRSGLDDCKAVMGEYVSRMAREKLKFRTEAADDKDAFFLPQYRSSHHGGFRRDVTPEKYAGKYTPAAYRNGNQWNNWDSRSRYSSNYQGSEGFNSARPRRNFIGDSVDKFDGPNFHEQRQAGDYLSRDMHRPFVRTRSPVERDNRFSMGKKMPPVRRINSYRSSAQYPQSADFEPVPNGPAAPVRFSRGPGREQSFSPHSVKDAHMPLNRRRSRSRSRTRSPRAWPSYREASFGNRRHSGSPDFRAEARMERVKVPFHKPKFIPEYREGREGYMSPPRGRFPNQRNSRWVGDRSYGDNNDRNFGENNFKRRRSPTGDFRFNNQSANSSGRFKSDEYYRTMNRPRRFPFVENGDRRTKFETMYDDEKVGNKEEMHRAMQRDNGGNFQRFQRDENNDFETRNLNNVEVVRAPVLRDVAQVQGAGEDKTETEI